MTSFKRSSQPSTGRNLNVCGSLDGVASTERADQVAISSVTKGVPFLETAPMSPMMVDVRSSERTRVAQANRSEIAMSLKRLPCLSITTGLLFAAASPASAQQVREARIAELIDQARVHVAQVPPTTAPQIDLSLDEAIERALKRNLDIAVERLNPPLMDLQIAQVNAPYRPTLTTTFSNGSQTTLSSNQLEGGLAVVQDNATVNASVRQSVPWRGGSYQISWNNNRNATNNVFSTFNPSYRTNFQASYRQPLLRGFAIDSTRQQLQVTQINRELSDVDLRQTITNTLAEVRNAYWDLAYASQAIDIQRQSLELAEQLVRDNRARVEIGTMAPIDIVQSQSEAATRRQSLAEARQNLRTAELTLKRLIVHGTDDELWQARIGATDRPSFTPESIDLEAAVRTALDQHTDLTRSRRQLDINNINLRALRDETLPSLDLVGSYQLQGQGGTRTIRSDLGGNVVAAIPGQLWRRHPPALRSRFPRVERTASTQLPDRPKCG